MDKEQLQEFKELIVSELTRSELEERLIEYYEKYNDLRALAEPTNENGALPIPYVSVRYYCCSDCKAKFDTKTWKPYWLKNAKHTIGNTSKICKGNYKEVNEHDFNAH